MLCLRLVGLLVVLLVIGTEADAQSQSEEAVQVPAQETDAERLARQAQEIIERDPEQEDYSDMERCIPAHRIREINVIDDKHVEFVMHAKQYFLVQLKHRCPGLRRGNPVIYEPSGRTLCATDGIRATYRNGLGSYQPGMRCALRGFQPVSKEQLVALKDALKAERRKRRAAKKAS